MICGRSHTSQASVCSMYKCNIFDKTSWERGASLESAGLWYTYPDVLDGYGDHPRDICLNNYPVITIVVNVTLQWV